MAPFSIKSALRFRQAICLSAFVGALFGVASPADASFHLWQIAEVLSNADGSVQFIEMFNGSANEYQIGGFALISMSDAEQNAFVFPDNIPFFKPTENKSLLIATPNFAALSGITPDFTLPDPTVEGHPFFNPDATNISITYDGSGDTISFTGASLPKTGAHSLTDTLLAFNVQNLVLGLDTPKNIDDQTTWINIAPPPNGDYNYNHTVDAADYVIWREQRNQLGIPPRTYADGTGDGTIDSSDYAFWRARFGNAAGSGSATVPEPSLAIFSQITILFLGLRRSKRPPH